MKYKLGLLTSICVVALGCSSITARADGAATADPTALTPAPSVDAPVAVSGAAAMPPSATPSFVAPPAETASVTAIPPPPMPGAMLGPVATPITIYNSAAPESSMTPEQAVASTTAEVPPPAAPPPEQTAAIPALTEQMVPPAPVPQEIAAVAPPPPSHPASAPIPVADAAPAPACKSFVHPSGYGAWLSTGIKCRDADGGWRVTEEHLTASPASDSGTTAVAMGDDDEDAP